MGIPTITVIGTQSGFDSVMGRDDPPLSRERSEWCNGGYAVVE